MIVGGLATVRVKEKREIEEGGRGREKGEGRDFEGRRTYNNYECKLCLLH